MQEAPEHHAGGAESEAEAEEGAWRDQGQQRVRAMILRVTGVRFAGVMAVGRVLTVAMAAVTMRSGVGRRPVMTVMSQATHGHGGQSNAAKCEAGKVEVHQLGRSVIILLTNDT